MPKFLILIIIFSLVFLFDLSLITNHSSLITAQTQSALDQAQQDYSFQLSKYRDELDRYQIAKSTYETFKTAVAKSDAHQKTKTYLDQVENLYIAYLLLVREHSNTIDFGQMEAEKTTVIQSLDLEVDYLREYKLKIAAAQTLEELPTLALEMDKHIKGTIEPKVNKTLATYELAEISSAFDDFLEISGDLDQLVSAKIQSGENSIILANWSSELFDIKEKTEASLNLAKDEYKTFGEQISIGQHNNIVKSTQATKTHLLRGKALFEEVARIL